MPERIAIYILRHEMELQYSLEITRGQSILACSSSGEALPFHVNSQGLIPCCSTDGSDLSWVHECVCG